MDKPLDFLIKEVKQATEDTLLASSGDKVSQIRILLEAHTTVESWGVPCITRLAELMGKSVPATRQDKVRLISEAQEYIRLRSVK